MPRWYDEAPTKEELAAARSGSWDSDPPTPEELEAAKAFLVPREKEKTIVERAGDYASSLSTLPSYIVGSIPVVGPAAQKTGAAIGAFGGTLAAGGDYEEFQRRYEAEKQAISEERKALEQSHPIISGIAGIGGAAMLPIAGPQMRLAQGAGALRTAATGTANVASRIAATGAEAAADAAVRGDDPEAAAETAMTWHAALEGLIKGGGKVVRAIPRMFTGISPETAAKYKARAPEIKAESEEQLIKDVLSGREKALVEPLERAKVAAEDAKATAKQAETLFRERLRDQDVPPDLAGRISDDMDEARKAVSAASTRGFEILQASDKTIDARPLKDYLTDKINSFKLAGDVVHPGDKPVIDLLQRERDFLDELPAEIRPEDAKRLVQSLDRMEQAAWDQAATAGGYVTLGDRAIMDYRRFVDKRLKEIPEYAEAMKQASTIQKSLDDVRKTIGKTPERIESSLRRMNQYKAEKLAGLEAVTGKKYAEELAPMQAAEELLSTPSRYRAVVEGLEESKAQRLAEEQAQDLGLWLDPVSVLGTTKSVQSALRSVESKIRPDYQNIEALGYLGDITKQDFLRRAENLAIQRAFDQGFTRGSRNVNLGSMSVSGLMKSGARILGGEGGTASGLGAAAGAGIGALADIIGPQQYRKYLDFTLRPGVAKAQDVGRRTLRAIPQAAGVASQTREP